MSTHAKLASYCITLSHSSKGEGEMAMNQCLQCVCRGSLFHWRPKEVQNCMLEGQMNIPFWAFPYISMYSRGNQRAKLDCFGCLLKTSWLNQFSWKKNMLQNTSHVCWNKHLTMYGVCLIELYMTGCMVSSWQRCKHTFCMILYPLHG